MCVFTSFLKCPEVSTLLILGRSWGCCMLRGAAIGLKIMSVPSHPKKGGRVRKWLLRRYGLQFPLGVGVSVPRNVSDSALVPVSLLVCCSQEPVLFFIKRGFFQLNFPPEIMRLCSQYMPCSKWNFLFFVLFHSCLSCLLRGI